MVAYLRRWAKNGLTEIPQDQLEQFHQIQGMGATTSVGGPAAILGSSTMEGNLPSPRFDQSQGPRKRGRRPARKVIWEAGEILVNSGQTNVLTEYYHHSTISPHINEISLMEYTWPQLQREDEVPKGKNSKREA